MQRTVTINIALVGALQRHFEQCEQLDLLHTEQNSKCKQPEEPLRVLAIDIESLARHAYAHMHMHAPFIQSELARD